MTIRRGPLVLLAAAVAAAALIAVELSRGSASYGEVRLHDPCLPRAGASFVLRGMDAVACRRDETREQLLLDAADSPLGAVAASVPDLKSTVERWLVASLQGLDAKGASETEQQAFSVLDALFAR